MKFLKIAAINFAILLSFSVVLEIILWVFFPIKNPKPTDNVEKNRYIYSYFEPNQKWEFKTNEGLPGLAAKWTFSTNNMGYRGDSLIMNKPKNEFRIFMIGGSTTECLYIDDSKSIERILQTNLQAQTKEPLIYKVYNAGKSGDNSLDHISMLAHRIMHLNPDLIIVFAGINDFRSTVSKGIYKHIYPRKKSKSSGNELLEASKDLVLNLQIGRRLYNIFKNNSIEEISFDTNIRKSANHVKTLKYSNSIPSYSVKPYQTNLSSISGICKKNNTKLMFMTQAVTWNNNNKDLKDLFWLLFTNNTRYNEKAMYKGLEDFNTTMRKVSKSQNIDLFDLDKTIPKNSQYFYDDCHFNIKGVAFAGERLANFLLTTNLASKNPNYH